MAEPPEDGNTSISGGSRAARGRPRPALVRISVEGRIKLPLDDFAAGDGRPDHGSVVGVAALIGNPGAHNVVPVLKRFTLLAAGENYHRCWCLQMKTGKMEVLGFD